jgi:ABC-type Fe3+-hydroxamate transport system substrate-binding protein
MAGDWFKMIADVAEALGVGEDAKQVFSGVNAYAEGTSTQTADASGDGQPYVYERRLTRSRVLGINDR